MGTGVTAVDASFAVAISAAAEATRELVCLLDLLLSVVGGVLLGGHGWEDAVLLHQEALV